MEVISNILMIAGILALLLGPIIWHQWANRPAQNPMDQAERLIKALDSGRERFVFVDTRIKGERCTVKADWTALTPDAKETIRDMLRRSRTNSEMRRVADEYNDRFFGRSDPK